MLTVDHRPATAQDINFIFNSWLKSYRNSDFAKKIPNDVYFSEHKEKITAILTNSTVLVACNPDTPSQIFGYLVMSQEPVTVLHYVYVKYPYRKLGIARRMVEDLNPQVGKKLTLCSHANYYWPEISAKFKLVYNPYI